VISYGVVYRVARQAARQVAPASTTTVSPGLCVPRQAFWNKPVTQRCDHYQTDRRNTCYPMSISSPLVPDGTSSISSPLVPDGTTSVDCDKVERKSQVVVHVSEGEEMNTSMSGVHSPMHSQNDTPHLSPSRTPSPSPLPDTSPPRRNPVIKIPEVWTVIIRTESGSENDDVTQRSMVNSVQPPRAPRITSSRFWKQFHGGGVTGCKETVSWWWSYWL
jgi:hypothetical protein